MAEELPFGPLSGRAVHLCLDMQVVFAEETDWHVPWSRRVMPVLLRLARAQPRRTIFTRFMPPKRVEDAVGTWRRYYTRWRHMTGERLDPRMTELVPELAELVPPAEVVCKLHYSPFADPRFHQKLQARGVDALVISGAETDVCVLATVLGAVDVGYRVVIPEDAVCSVSDEAHDSLLRLYHDRFGQQIEVAPTGTILANWRDD